MKRLIAVFATVFLSICWFTLPSRGEPVIQTTGRASQSQQLPSNAIDALLQHKMQFAADVKAWNESVWYTKVAENERWYAAVAENERQAAAKADADRKAKEERINRSSRPGFIGDRIAGCEGGQDYLHRDHGPESTASGKYGFLDGTWDGLDGVKGNGFKGYGRAMDAPESIQDEGFVILWNDGKGAGHWSQSRKCWG